MTDPNESENVEMAEDDQVITGKVVDFLNNREIIMNVGKADGVKIGMQFVVLVPGGVPVEFGEGDEKFVENVEVPKAVVKVVRFSGERLSIGRTFMTIKGHAAYEVDNPLYFGGALGRLKGLYSTEPTRKFPAAPDRVETFDVERNDTIRAGVDMKVRKGDEVRLTTGEEFIFPG